MVLEAILEVQIKRNFYCMDLIPWTLLLVFGKPIILLAAEPDLRNCEFIES